MDQASQTQSSAGGATAPGDIHHRIGQLTRQLHDTLNELGYADSLKGAMSELPDAQSRLSYIARVTGEAAEKVLSRVELAKAEHDTLVQVAQEMADMIVKDPVGALAKGHVLNFVHEVQKVSGVVDHHLTEIMMAQDFHDLTGQVIKRVVDLTSSIEEQLVKLVILTAPGDVASSSEAGKAMLSGPVMNPEGNPEVVTNQSQVDDLLASLGF